ncbi:MAG TPA: epoxide hydrolase [Hyphomicrobiaceae bacterium]|nr:epoxide hydrolase [Hyphomicrobiaceae bacterium]
MPASPRPFTLAVPEADIADLFARLARTRLPDQAPDGPWAYGTDVGYLGRLIEHWRTRFDWRHWEGRLNAFPQFKVALDGIDLHYLNVPGKGPAPKPLLLLHGWPGSVFEFVDIIPRLTDPASFGGDAADAFTVIAPSLPGYGLSFVAGQKRFGIPAMADCFARLMTDVLGYRKFAAQGGDWGAFTCSAMGVRHPEKLSGIHLNMLSVSPYLPPPANPTDAERRYQDEIRAWAKEETGYIQIQGTRPQTLAFALTDSPAGLAAWIAEKFHVWTDHAGDFETVVSRDHLLANISLYWFTGAIGSSFWPYYERLHGPWPIPDGKTVDVPLGYAAFPREIRRPPRSLAEKSYTDIRQWTEMAKGGHFAAMEQPEALARDVQAFFRPLRGTF